MSIDTMGDRIKSILSEKRLSQKELAKAIGLSEKQVSRIINSEVEPGVNKVKSIAEFLNLDLHWLISGTSYNYKLQEKEYWRISDGAHPGYSDLRSARHIRIIMNACGMSKEQFANALGIELSLFDHYLDHGIPESEIILKIIDLGREKAGLPIDLKWFVTGLEKTK